jgi:integrase
VFVPEHVALKKLAGRTHYHAILKHILRPEEVERVFEVNATNWKTRLRVVPNWPYLGAVRLCDAQPDDVQRLISAALARGYSSQTVRHMRNGVMAIFEHAKRRQWFSGQNPAGLVKLPSTTRKEAHELTVAQTKEVLGRMQYPEKEMTLIALLTGMNLAEICGLQWKYVNLTEDWAEADGEPIAPRTVVVRKQYYRGELGGLSKQSRSRDLPIPDSLLSMLLSLRRLANFAGADDFVVASRTGSPVDAKEIATHRLKSIGRDLHLPWLSWQVVQRTRKGLLHERGTQFQSDPTFLANESPGSARRTPCL